MKNIGGRIDSWSTGIGEVCPLKIIYSFYHLQINLGLRLNIPEVLTLILTTYLTNFLVFLHETSTVFTLYRIAIPTLHYIHPYDVDLITLIQHTFKYKDNNIFSMLYNWSSLTKIKKKLNWNIKETSQDAQMNICTNMDLIDAHDSHDTL